MNTSETRRFAFVSTLGADQTPLSALLRAIHASGRGIIIATSEDGALLRSLSIEPDEMSDDKELLVFNTVLTLLQTQHPGEDIIDLVVLNFPRWQIGTPRTEGPTLNQTGLSMAMVAMAAANNPKLVLVSCSPAEWPEVFKYLEEGEVPLKYRLDAAYNAFVWANRACSRGILSTEDAMNRLKAE